MNKIKEELVFYILNHKEEFDKIVDSINTIKAQSDDISLYKADENKTQTRMHRIALKKMKELFF